MSREHVAGVPIISMETQQELSEKQLLDFRSHKRDILRWLATFGKNPDKGEGYSDTTIEQLTYQLGSFYRWVWEQEGQYTTKVTPDHADAYMKEIAYGDTTNGHKSTVMKCLKRLFKYRRHQLGENAEWDPDFSFSEPHSKPQDYLTADERQAIREAALEYGSVPAYNSLSPEERDEWKAHLAQRFDKPKSEVGLTDFERANGWKFASLTWASLDTGFRPIEVKRARVSWVDALAPRLFGDNSKAFQLELGMLEKPTHQPPLFRVDPDAVFRLDEAEESLFLFGSKPSVFGNRFDKPLPSVPTVLFGVLAR